MREGLWESTFRMLQRSPAFRQEREGKLAGCWVLKPPRGEASIAPPASDTGEGAGAGDGAVDGADDATKAAEHSLDKVLVRSNGILTYTAKDIAYHLWKFGLLPNRLTYAPFPGGAWSTHPSGVERDIGHADVAINVIDHRQQYPQEMVKLALRTLGYGRQADNLRHVGYGVVSLSAATASLLGVDTSEGKASYAMSGRQGIGIKAADLVDRMEAVVAAARSRQDGLDSRSIAAAAIRYYLLKYHLQSEVVFDIGQATELTGNTGVYVMYGYARASSLSENAAAAGWSADAARLPVEGLCSHERSLLRRLVYWPDALEEAVREWTPNTICTYAYELTARFNAWYAACPIMKAPEPDRAFRLWLTERYRATLRECLDLLGMPAPSRM